MSHKIRDASKQTGSNGIIMLDLTSTEELWKDKEALFSQIRRDLERLDIDSILVKRGDMLARYYKKITRKPYVVKG